MRNSKSFLSAIRSTLAVAAVLGSVFLLLLAAPAVEAGTATYKYDSVGRVAEINYGTGVFVKYSYDAAGNRSIELVTGTGVLSPEAKAAVIAMLFQLLLDDD